MYSAGIQEPYIYLLSIFHLCCIDDGTRAENHIPAIFQICSITGFSSEAKFDRIQRIFYWWKINDTSRNHRLSICDSLICHWCVIDLSLICYWYAINVTFSSVFHLTFTQIWADSLSIHLRSISVSSCFRLFSILLPSHFHSIFYWTGQPLQYSWQLETINDTCVSHIWYHYQLVIARG